MTQTLIQAALEARNRAYCPYSHFAVGAALLAQVDGEARIYTGCNIENAAYSPTNCAERTAFFKAVSEGAREFTAIAIVGGPEGEDAPTYCTPCGVCRQVMAEFCAPDRFQVICAKSPENFRSYTLAELLPAGFGPGDLP